MFRYYAATRNAMLPSGSATLYLVGRAISRTRGNRKSVAEAIDHGPLFEKNAVLGFSPRPGRYRITETLDSLHHVFDLSVDAKGHRATSYQPPRATKRILITGDSALFGWGLDDEETMPWLLQTRLPDYQVINLTMTSYSSVQALLQLQQLDPPPGPDDIVVLEYQCITNPFTVGDAELLHPLQHGYELQLGDAAMRQMDVPYAVLDGGGKATIHRVNLACVGANRPDCAVPQPMDLSAAKRVTAAVFDEILAHATGHLVMTYVKGPDDDAVVRHLRSRGVLVADVRSHNGYPDASDVIAIDSHPGPFWHHQIYDRLLDALLRSHLVE